MRATFLRGCVGGCSLFGAPLLLAHSIACGQVVADPPVTPITLRGAGLGGAPVLSFDEFGEQHVFLAFWRDDLPRVITLLFYFGLCTVIAPAHLFFFPLFEVVFVSEGFSFLFSIR